jgi:hypothetical protein
VVRVIGRDARFVRDGRAFVTHGSINWEWFFIHTKAERAEETTVVF